MPRIAFNSSSPTITTRIINLPVEIRNQIWSYYFWGYHSLRIILPSTCQARPNARCACCSSPQNSQQHHSNNQLVPANRALSSDAEHWVYKRLEFVAFCSEKCIAGYLGESAVAGPLVWTPCVRFQARSSSKEEAQTRALHLLRQLKQATDGHETVLNSDRKTVLAPSPFPGRDAGFGFGSMGNRTITPQSGPHQAASWTIAVEKTHRHIDWDTFPERGFWTLRADKSDEAVPGRALLREGWTLHLQELNPLPTQTDIWEQCWMVTLARKA